MHGDSVLDTPELSLPHPRLGQRAFVLRPLREIAPGMQHLEGSLAAVAGQALERLPAADDWPPG